MENKESLKNITEADEGSVSAEMDAKLSENFPWAAQSGNRKKPEELPELERSDKE